MRIKKDLLASRFFNENPVQNRDCNPIENWVDRQQQRKSAR
jgi:hypothetical protein